MKHTIVVKLGGSMISTKNNIVDFRYLMRLKKILIELTNNNFKIFITTGGGFLARNYISICRDYVEDEMDLHWIGTTCNNLNAEIVRAILGGLANDRIVYYEQYYDDTKFRFEKKIILGGGGRAGHSGDVDAILASRKINSKTIFSLKNIDGVYSADPKKDTNAQRIDKLSWDEYFRIIGFKKEHEPGGNYPVDPIASQMAKKDDIKFIILDGKNLENFKNAVLGKKFLGSVISN